MYRKGPFPLVSASLKKAKVTLSVDAEVYEEAKEAAATRGVALSHLVERYLQFLVTREVHCLVCGEGFSSWDAALCATCGWLKCTECDACRCSVGEEAGRVAFHFRRTLEELVGERIG